MNGSYSVMRSRSHGVSLSHPVSKDLSQYCWASSPSYSLGVVKVLLHSEGFQLVHLRILVLNSIWELVEFLRCVDETLVLLCGVPPLG